MALPVLSFFTTVFKPILMIMEKTLNLFLKTKMEGRPEKGLGFSTDELMLMLTDSGRDLEISPECLEMMKRLLQMHKRSASDIMTPLHKIEFIDMERIQGNIETAIDLFIEAGHSRVPIRQGSSFIGHLHAKDILKTLVKVPQGSRDLKALLRPLPGVDGHRSVGELLNEFDENRCIALVRGPDASVIGLVTLEDILEEITGEILDEYDLSTHP